MVKARANKGGLASACAHMIAGRETGTRGAMDASARSRSGKRACKRRTVVSTESRQVGGALTEPLGSSTSRVGVQVAGGVIDRIVVPFDGSGGRASGYE